MRMYFAALVLDLVFAAAAHAAAPPILPLQGNLTDASGTPINSAVIVQFALYATATGSTALWSETQTITPAQGIFAAYLGAQASMPLNIFRDNGTLYLGVKVGTDAEMPRVQIGSAPYAGFAQFCGSVAAVDVSALPTAVPVGPLTCGGEVVTGIDSSGNLECSPDHDTLGSLTCSTGQVAKFNGTAWACTGLTPTITTTQVGRNVVISGAYCASAEGTPCASGVAVGGDCDLGIPNTGESLAFAGLNAAMTAYKCTVCQSCGGACTLPVAIRTYCMTFGP